MRKISTVLLLIFFTALSLFAQSNEIIDTYLDQPQADLTTSIWLVLLSENLIPEDADTADAMAFFKASEFSRKIPVDEPDRPIEFGEFAYIAMEAMDLPGGMMYAIFPTPRYASREFLYRRWMPGRPKQGAYLTPWEVTSSLSELIAWKEAQK